MADISDGGALICFRDECTITENNLVIPNDDFIKRQIIELEIPTFDKMRNVMFYDVLMKLCHQTVKMHF